MTIAPISGGQVNYTITQIGYSHKLRVGRTMQHVFHVKNNDLAFKLLFDTETLSWFVLEVSDGTAD